MTDQSERIAAYLDGAMSEAEMQAFEAEMENDEALAGEVARYVANDDLLRAAFDGPMHEPTGQALLERMGLAHSDDARTVPVERSTSSDLAAANDNPPFLQRWRWPLGGAIAASLALVAVLQTLQQPAARDGFSIALDETPSSVAVPLDDGSSLTPRLTFAANDGRYCREYLKAGAGQSETGIACRSGGKWAIEARVAGGAALQASDEIAAASGSDASRMDEAYARLGASDPLDATREQALISGNWAAEE